MIDVATRTVPAAVLRPTTRSVDASVLLARALTPEPMRPGWPASLAMAHSALPYDRLLGIDERLRHAAARPVIVPDTIVIDHGSVFVSANFRSSCRHLGISIQPAHLATGSDKPHIEKMFSTLGTLFCQFAAGYLGRSADRRGATWKAAAVVPDADAGPPGRMAHSGLAEQGPRRAAGPAAPAADVLPEPEVRRADRDGRVRAGPAQRRGPHRAAARGLAGRQRLRRQDQPPDLRRCGAEPDPAAEIRASPPGRDYGRSATTPTTCPGCSSAGPAAGSPARGSTWGKSRSRSGSWPGTTFGTAGRAGAGRRQRAGTRPGRRRPAAPRLPRPAGRPRDRRRGHGPATAAAVSPRPAGRRPHARRRGLLQRQLPSRRTLPARAGPGTTPETPQQDSGEPIAKVIPLGIFNAHEEAKKRW